MSYCIMMLVMDVKQFLKTYDELILYTLVGIVIGVIVSLLEVIFGKGILFLTDVRLSFSNWTLFLLPVAGLLIVYAFVHISIISSKGMNLVFEIDQAKRDKIPLWLIPLMVGSTWLTHLCGGSAGKEGVAVQIGATTAHFMSRRFHNTDTSMIFLVAGMAAGFAGLFGTPFTAIFFSMEVLVAGTLKYRAMLPCIASSFTASWISSFFGIGKSAIGLDVAYALDALMFVKLAILGILFGSVGGLFAAILKRVKTYLQSRFDRYRLIFFGGIGLALLLFAFGGRYSGLGSNLIDMVVSGQDIYWYDWLLKFGFTIFTLAIGFQGGEVTPLLTIGMTLGCVLGPVFGFSPLFCAALGYAAVFGSGTNTFLAPVMMGMEIFGFGYFPFFFLVCAMAYMTNRNQSIYALQQRMGN